MIQARSTQTDERQGEREREARNRSTRANSVKSNRLLLSNDFVSARSSVSSRTTRNPLPQTCDYNSLSLYLSLQIKSIL